MSAITLPSADVAEEIAEDSLALDTIQLVSFRLDQEEYGIEITRVREIILMGQITRLPQTPHYLKGLINLRSTVIPVIDLRLRFGMPCKAPDEDTRIVVVTVKHRTVGIVVDAVSEVMRVDRKQITAPPDGVCGATENYPAEIVQFEDRLIMLLNIDDVFAGQDSELADAADLH